MNVNSPFLRAAFFVIAAAVTSLLLACGGGAGGTTPAVGTTAAGGQPRVEIRSPQNGAHFATGDAVAVQSVSNDSGGLVRVELMVDGQVVQTANVPNPSATQAYTAVLQWTATTPGAHALIVRAFNLAGLSGEQSVAISVDGGAASTTVPQVDTVTPPVDATTVGEPTTVTIPLETDTVAPAEITATSEPPPTALPTLTDTPVPPTATSAPPTATPAPLVFNPFPPGGADVSVNTDGNTISIRGDFSLHDSGPIDRVDLFVYDGNGKLVVQDDESAEPYCYQGDDGSECNIWDFSDHNNQWHNGAPSRTGLAFPRVLGHTTDNFYRVDEEPYWFDPVGDNPQPPIFLSITQIGPDNIDTQINDALVFEAQVQNDSDLPITRVDLYVTAYDGTILHVLPQNNAPYCAYDDQNNQCNVFNFNANHFKWSNGTPITRTQIVLRAIAYSGNRPVAGTSQAVELEP